MIEKIVDLRSDTITKPTQAMRIAMANADVGDDQYEEDPTVNRLQKRAAEILGKEDALLVPSGTMGNTASVLTHCNRGDEVIMGNISHTFLLETGGLSALGGVHPCILPNQNDGSLGLEAIKAAIRSDRPHCPISKLIILENTHNRCGGAPLSVQYTRQVGDIAKENKMLLHIDGARIFNAAIALGVKASQLVESADSITFCLSKGLCCPVGSMVCGSADFIHRLRRIRQQMGGAMRQSGILAAAGLVALDEMIDRLADDHRRAYVLAEKLAKIPGLKLKFGMPKTNIIFILLDENIPETAFELAERMKQYGLRVHVTGKKEIRLLTHFWISDEDIEFAAEIFGKVI